MTQSEARQELLDACEACDGECLIVRPYEVLLALGVTVDAPANDDMQSEVGVR